jgi:raffinose/stachyose/melibiose transport system substrate-binding protein
MQYFPSTSLVAWQTDDAKETFCMPVASVIHGFLYNKNIFKKLNLSVPTTQAEFFNALNIIKKNSSYLPLALGTADRWESSQTVFTNIGPTFWHGEEGRKALIAGKAKFTDTSFLAALDFEAKLATYLPKNVGTQTYSESQNLFAQGRAAIFPLGSWDIAYFNQVAGLEFGVFAPPVKTSGDQCVISDHMDIGLGINKHSKNKEDAYKFLAWIGSQEFAALYTNRMTGFFTLSNHLIALDDPIAKQMLDWRNQCLSTIRLSSQALNRGTPNMETALWNINADVLNGNLNAKEAAFKLQTEFAKWQKPLHP